MSTAFIIVPYYAALISESFEVPTLQNKGTIGLSLSTEVGLAMSARDMRQFFTSEPAPSPVVKIKRIFLRLLRKGSRYKNEIKPDWKQEHCSSAAYYP